MSRSYDEAPSEQVTRRLLASLTQESTHADRLAERLERAEGPAWLRRALAGAPFDALQNPEHELAHAPTAAGLEALNALKEAGKRHFESAPTDDGRLVGTLAYFLAVAAARVHHDATISSQPPLEMAPALERIAAALPPPWVDLAAEAAVRLRRS